MDELVCLQCGKEMEYDWAPCSHCGWKAPEHWDSDDLAEEEPRPTQPGLRSKNHPWVRWVSWLLLILALAGLWDLFVHH